MPSIRANKSRELKRSGVVPHGAASHICVDLSDLSLQLIKERKIANQLGAWSYKAVYGFMGALALCNIAADGGDFAARSLGVDVAGSRNSRACCSGVAFVGASMGRNGVSGQQTVTRY